MLYFVQTAMFFEESSLDELRSLARFKIIDRQLNNFIIDANGNLQERIKERGTIFVHSAFKLLSKSRISKKDYLGSIYRALLKVVKGSKIRKGEVIRLECYDINNRQGYSAKDLEVAFGRMLIKNGYIADLVNPSRLVYVVLLNGNCYVGESLYADLAKRVLNPLRAYSHVGHTSRAEMKIAEAFQEFGIKGTGIAVDLGAAPGGWSRFLAKKGFKVIAIDTAKLDYSSLKEVGLKVKAVGSQAGVQDCIMNNDIVHLKAKSDAALGQLKASKADLLAEDMNMDCESSAAEVVRYAKVMRRGGTLLMTIKCVTRNAPRYIKQARRILDAKFLIKGIKVLPANRQELTLYAIYKG